MNENNIKQNEDTRTNASVADRLPPLNEETIQELSNHHNRQFAHGFMGDRRDGETYTFNKLGVNIQRVNKDKVRCISVVDHPDCYWAVANMRVTFEAAGIEVQLDPYTVVTPYEEPVEEEPVEEEPVAAGMEVA